MPIDVSAFGLSIQIIASQTFPQGITLSAFADDTDPIDSASIQVRDKAMGVNGDLIKWSKAVAVPMVIGLLPNTDDDANMQILAAANRAAKGRRAVQDEITAVINYPDGTSQRLLRGTITDAMMGRSVASAGRIKSQTYTFAFEDIQSS